MFVVDSGARETVIGEGMLSDIRCMKQPTERESPIWVNSHSQHTHTHRMESQDV